MSLFQYCELFKSHATNAQLNKTNKASQDLKTEFKEERETLKKAQAEMTKELKNSVSHEDRLSVLEDTVEDRDEIGKEYKKCFKSKRTCRVCEIRIKTESLNYRQG